VEGGPSAAAAADGEKPISRPSNEFMAVFKQFLNQFVQALPKQAAGGVPLPGMM